MLPVPERRPFDVSCEWSLRQGRDHGHLPRRFFAGRPSHADARLAPRTHAPEHAAHGGSRAFILPTMMEERDDVRA